MPFDKPGLLAPSEVYAASAFILNLNGIIDEDAVMNAADAAEGPHAEPRRLRRRPPSRRPGEAADPEYPDVRVFLYPWNRQR